MKNKGKIIAFLLTAIMAICMLSFSAFAQTINCGNTDKVVVKVVWDDENNYDGLRKNVSISIQGRYYAGLLPDYLKTITRNVDIVQNEQTIEYNNLPKQKEITIDYIFWKETYKYDVTYTLDIPDLPGYNVDISNSGNEYIIKYTHNVVKKNITVNSSWIDENNFDGFRKNTSFSLVRKTCSSSKVVETKEIKSSEESQKFSFTDLRTYLNGEECDYFVELNSVPDKYRENIDKYSITLTHTVQRATIRAIKYWDDKDNENKVRPEKVIFELFSDGQPTGEFRTLESRRHVLKDYDTIWSLAEWENLPMYKDGKLINYTVKEVDVPDFYKSEMLDKINTIGDRVILNYVIDSNAIVIKNTYDGAKRDITVNVEWKEDTVDTRPTDYKIQLKANDKDKYAAVSLSTNENTSYKYQNIPANYDGNKIKYSVVQLGVDDTKYKTNITEKDGVFTIVNTLIKASTVEPTAEPTVEPTQTPTQTPTETPTETPTHPPTVTPTLEPTDDVNTTIRPIVTYPPFTPANPTANVSEEPTVMPSEEVTVVPTEENGFNSNEGSEDDVTVQPTKENNLEGLDDDNSDDKLDGEIKNSITVEKALKSVDNSTEDIDETPKTGDNNNNVGMYVILLFITVCGIVTLYIVRKRV